MEQQRQTAITLVQNLNPNSSPKEHSKAINATIRTYTKAGQNLPPGWKKTSANLRINSNEQPIILTQLIAIKPPKKQSRTQSAGGGIIRMQKLSPNVGKTPTNSTAQSNRTPHYIPDSGGDSNKHHIQLLGDT